MQNSKKIDVKAARDLLGILYNVTLIIREFIK